MSSFIGNASGGTAGVGTFAADDMRLWPVWAKADTDWIDKTAAFRANDFSNPRWPGSGRLDASGNDMLQSVSYGQPELTSGAVSRVMFAGVSRDQYGSVLVSCTLKLFKTADGNWPGTKDLKMDEGVSDALSGAFILMSPYYPDTHFITLHKTGTPDVAGCSINTLIGT